MENEANDIFSLLGLSNLSEEDKQSFINNFMEILQGRVMVRMDAILNESQKIELDKISEENKNNPEKIVEFLYDLIPNYQQIVEEETHKLREELMGDAKGADSLIS